MTAFLIVLAVAAEAYLLGSVDTGILISKFVYHDDVRTHGSGAAGMTNMLRTFGKKAAAMIAHVVMIYEFADEDAGIHTAQQVRLQDGGCGDQDRFHH